MPPRAESAQENHKIQWLVGHCHGGETGGAQQHAGDDHRLGAEAIGDGAAKDAEPLLQQLAQAKCDADDQRGPAQLIDEADRNKRKDDKEA